MDGSQINFDDVIQDSELQPPHDFIDVIKSDTLKGAHIYAQGFLQWHLWSSMAVAEIRRRYRRTLFGPFWLTLSIAIFIGSMGLIFPILWHTDVKTFLPFFSSGFIIWTFISTIITDGCGTFLDASGLIKQTSLPYSVYSNSAVTRNFLVILHHFVFYLAIVLLFKVPVNLNTLLIIPAMMIIGLTGSWVCILLGLMTARFRDIRQFVTSLLQIAMFITPVFWSPTQLGNATYAKILVAVNPLYHFVEIARAPLLGLKPAPIDWIVTMGICIVGWLVSMKILGKFQRHLVFWL
ncbi:MAG: ABC transporter permease [Legionellaceae bacterium]|nr:ABC transporter permease [Legionellaceae bacterium]